MVEETFASSEAPRSQSLRRQGRRREILSATLRLLRKHGAGVTTAQIASEARCSKETLYSWFGDRDGLMLALVQEQARSMGEALDRTFARASGTLEARLHECCVVLLDMLTGESTLAVNRVAMAQACRMNTELGDAVLSGWKEETMQPFARLFQEGNASGELAVHSANEAFENLIGLLVGDRQRQLLLGAPQRPNPSTMSGIARKAVQRWLILYHA